MVIFRSYVSLQEGTDGHSTERSSVAPWNHWCSGICSSVFGAIHFSKLIPKHSKQYPSKIGKRLKSQWVISLCLYRPIFLTLERSMIRPARCTQQRSRCCPFKRASLGEALSSFHGKIISVYHYPIIVIKSHWNIQQLIIRYSFYLVNHFVNECFFTIIVIINN